MDQGLKERLLGAAVLVVIAVWLIPWVLDGPEDGAETQASSLQLPSAEEPMPMRTQTLKLGAASGESAQDAPAPAPAPAAPAAAPPQQPAVATAEPVRDTTAAPSQPQPQPQAETTLAAAAVPAERPPPAAAASTPPKPDQPKVQGDWTVQLGSFSDEANAKRMAQRAGTYGYKAEVSSVRSSGKTLYRVRVGPQATRAAADAAASALKAHGVDARVVAAR
ncbi:MAG TPA: SPOR domain-containing protein [Gammaproteobacteria bacterium]|nr:SPOR domain-containing protein [Gammaproteobacteria bacterium]